MKNFLLTTTLCGVVLTGFNVSSAQEKCGLDITTREMLSKNPALVQVFENYRAESKEKADAFEAAMSNTAAKGTASVTIPIVFHVILTQEQIDNIGGTTGIMNRVNTQLTVLNKDFNGLNTDSSTLPAAFKALFGNPEISFALAHRKPDGKATDGVEIRVAPTNIQGFDGQSPNSKKFISGGLDPWDNTKYLNVWVVNISDNSLLGYAYSPYYAKNIVQDANLTGVVVDFGAFGVKPISTSYYWHASAVKGRTLTHELGHFFNLWHIWGNSSATSGTCSDDDDIDDTPKQKIASTDCSGYPAANFDECTPAGNGVMYMNYMDYSGDDCTRMFTKKQAARMKVEVSSGGNSHGLTTHPELIYWPSDVSSVERDNQFDIYPNPSNGNFKLSFAGMPEDLQSITVMNTVGQVVYNTVVTEKKLTHHVDIANAPAGVYMVQLHFSKGQITRKVMIQ